LISGLFSLPLAPADAAAKAGNSLRRDSRSAGDAAFITGPENALVRALATAVSEIRLPYSPIVIYGPIGIGKSSLAHALTALRQRRQAITSVIVTTGSELAGAVAHAIDSDSIADLRSRYRRCDLLLIDDLHQLTEKPAAQQFLLRSLDALIRRGSLVIVTMRQAPQATAGLVPALASRLAGGLVVGLAPPGALARRELVRQTVEQSGLALDEQQIARLAGDGLASRYTTAAMLRHAVLKLGAAKELGSSDGEEMTLAANQSPDVKAVCHQVAKAVARQFGITTKDLKGKSRRQSVVEARSLAMYIARRLTAASYAELGRHFGGRDHTTVLHACRKMASSDEITHRLADELATHISVEGTD
jgi:chromosomal replication initiator protein